jgi:hypothetical protein
MFIWLTSANINNRIQLCEWGQRKIKNQNAKGKVTNEKSKWRIYEIR